MDEIYRELDSLRRRVAGLEGIEVPKYAAGTFTPTWSGTGTAGTYTYSAQLGTYVRWGSVVLFRLRITITAITVNPTGDMRIAGLPLTASAGQGVPVTLTGGNFNTSAGCIQLMARALASGTQIALSETFDGAAEAFFPATQFILVATPDIQIAGLYFV